MLPNEMVLAPLQKLKIKYELSYQSTTRLKYVDKFDQLLIFHQWTSTNDKIPNMRLPQYSQSNDEEPYYILKTNNTFLFCFGNLYIVMYFMQYSHCQMYYRKWRPRKWRHRKSRDRKWRRRKWLHVRGKWRHVRGKQVALHFKRCGLNFSSILSLSFHYSTYVSSICSISFFHCF
jgi:hypothetical protein